MSLAFSFICLFNHRTGIFTGYFSLIFLNIFTAISLVFTATVLTTLLTTFMNVCTYETFQSTDYYLSHHLKTFSTLTDDFIPHISHLSFSLLSHLSFFFLPHNFCHESNKHNVFCSEGKYD